MYDWGTPFMSGYLGWLVGVWRSAMGTLGGVEWMLRLNVTSCLLPEEFSDCPRTIHLSIMRALESVS